MAKQVVKKTKIKFLNILIVLIVLIGLVFAVKCFLETKTKNIIVSGTNYLGDDYVLELGGLKNYPKFVLLDRKKVCSKLEESSYINKCNVKKKLGFVLEVELKENKALFYDNTSEKYVLEDGSKSENDDVSLDFRVPRLLNYVPDVKFEKFITNMGKIDDYSLSEIGDIEYVPNDYDKDRFLLYMDDGNMVYLTLTKFKMINHYREVVPQLDGHKGILYLDSGNHFEIKE